MKQLVNRTVTLLLLSVVWAAGSASAQTAVIIKVHIPFEFSLGGQTFPPGDYSLTQPLQHFLVLRDARGQSIASTFTNGILSSEAPATSKLKFYSAGGRHELIEVWRQDDATGQHLYPANTKNGNYIAKQRSPEPRQTAEGSKP